MNIEMLPLPLKAKCPECKGDGFTGRATDPEPDFCEECSGSGEIEVGEDELTKAYAEGRADEAQERLLRIDLLEAENARLRSLLEARIDPEIETLPKEYT